MNPPKPSHDSVLPFLVLVFVIAIPFWILGALVEPKNIPINLPLSSLVVVALMFEALILVFRHSGAEGVKTLLRRALDYLRIQQKVWYVPVFLLMPLIAVLSYIILILMGRNKIRCNR